MFFELSAFSFKLTRNKNGIIPKGGISLLFTTPGRCNTVASLYFPAYCLQPTAYCLLLTFFKGRSSLNAVKRYIWVLLLLFSMAYSGCGYRFSGSGMFPGNVRSIFIWSLNLFETEVQSQKGVIRQTHFFLEL